MNLSDIPKIVINLPERKDRLAHIKKELSGWEYQLMPGVVDKDPKVGIAQAHMNCILLARQSEWDNVLIIEDDMVLRKGAHEYFNKALNTLPENWDILLGGLYNCKYQIPVNEYWNRTGEFCGAHFYIANHTSYDRILSCSPRQHIDRWINQGGNKLNCFVTKKFVATQLNGFSDNIKRNVDYSKELKKFELL